MISSTYFFLLSPLILLTTTVVQAAQISFNSYSPQVANIVSSGDSGLLLIKDTAQAHYESIIDDILSQHNEGLLTELSIVIKDPKQMYAVMKPQADLLYPTPSSSAAVQDVCVAQMPGMIANQIHELSNEIYLSVNLIVSKYWKKTDTYYRQLVLNAINKGLWEQDVMNELVNSVQVLNMDISDRITETVDQFNMLNRLKKSLLNCQSIFGGELPAEAELSLSEKIWNAILFSFSLSNPITNDNEIQQKGFMGRYVFELKSDIQSEMYSRVYELARSIYEDLAFSA